MKSLGITIREISIADAVRQHFKDIDHNIDVHDVTYENSQARERTQILMDLSNQLGALVIGTGDLSELALGWATYNGDHMSMYGVNAGVPKTLIKYLVKFVAMSGDSDETRNILLDIIDTPISPELIPADDAGNITQKTEDLVGPYELHDFFLYHIMRFGFRPSKIFMLARKAFDGNNPDAPFYDDETIKNGLQYSCAVSSISSLNVLVCQTDLKLVVLVLVRVVTGACQVTLLLHYGLESANRFKCLMMLYQRCSVIEIMT